MKKILIRLPGLGESGPDMVYLLWLGGQNYQALISQMRETKP